MSYKREFLRHVGFLAVALVAMFQVAPGQTVLFRHPQPGDIYREYSRVMIPYAEWRVTDPNATNAGAIKNLPNKNLPITIDDLTDAIRAEVVVDVAMWHAGTYNKKIRFNGKTWLPLPEIQTTPSAGQCFAGSVIVTAEIPLADLKVGQNTFEGTNGGQTCFDFGWGQHEQAGVIVRVYYKSTKSHPTGSITSPSNGGTFGENPTISVSTAGSVSRVDVIGYYEGPDIDGDGIYRDWQYHYHRLVNATSMVIQGHIGTRTSAPYNVPWNTDLVPDQLAGGVKLIARILGTNGVWFVTNEVTGLTLQRNGASVRMFKSSDVPQRFGVRATRESRHCNIVIPAGLDLSKATSAKLSVTTWNGTNKQARAGETGYSKFNNQNLGLYGADENWAHNIVNVNLNELKIGTNRFDAYSNSSGFGLYFSWPGPSLIVRFGGSTPPPNPVPAKLAFGVQPTNTQAGNTISPAVTVLIQDAGGNLVTTDTRPVTVSIAANPAGGTLGGTKTVNAVGGIATFNNLSIDNAGNAYTLGAVDGGLTGATSNAFNITSGTPPPPPPPPTGNILPNGGFESGKTGWMHFANGGPTNAFTVVTSAPIAEGTRKGCVVIDANRGTNNQIYAKNLPLEAGVKYTLTFQAYASKATTIQVRVLEQDDDYTIYGFNFQTFALTTGWQTFTVEFTAANFAGTVNDAMLQFFFAKSSASTTIYFDDIIIGAGATPPPPPAVDNVLVNGGFESGKTGWRHFQNGGAGNAFSVVNTAPVAEGTRKGMVGLGPTIGTNNQLYQRDVKLTAGLNYLLSFSAYASKPTTIQVRVIEQDGTYRTYGFGFKTVNLTTGFQTFAFNFTAANFAGTVNDGMVQFYFVKSSPSTTLYFDDVILGVATTTAPAGAPLTEKSGEGYAEEAAEVHASLPASMELMQNYPNPFNPSTRIEYALPSPSYVTLEVYNMLGERVAVLVDESQSAGYYTARFDASHLPSGMYFSRLTTNTASLIRKMMLVK